MKKTGTFFLAPVSLYCLAAAAGCPDYSDEVPCEITFRPYDPDARGTPRVDPEVIYYGEPSKIVGIWQDDMFCDWDDGPLEIIEKPPCTHRDMAYVFSDDHAVASFMWDAIEPGAWVPVDSDLTWEIHEFVTEEGSRSRLRLRTVDAGVLWLDAVIKNLLQNSRVHCFSVEVLSAKFNFDQSMWPADKCLATCANPPRR